MLLLFFGAGSSAPPPQIISNCGFQPNAFQNSAFQNCGTGKTVGWPDTLRRRVPRKELERLLELQKNKTFGRRWFEEFEQAQAGFAATEKKVALAEAAQEARRAVHSVAPDYRFNELAAALQVARGAKRVKDALAAADYAKGIARAIQRAADDDVDALMLLFGAEQVEVMSDDEEGLEILLG